MSFRNPVVGGGDTLVRQAIQSEGFTLDPESNVTGWRIERDGNAYFTGVTVGNLNYFIDENGNGSFNDVSVNGTLTVGGDTLDNILSRYARGVIALNTLPNDTGTWDGTNPVLFGRIVITDFDATRQYKVAGIARFDPGANGPNHIAIQARSAWNAPATLSDTLLFQDIQGGRDPAVADDWVTSFHHCFANTAPQGDLHIAFYFSCNSGATGQKYLGTSYGRVWVEDAGPIVTYGTFDPGTGNAPPQQFVKTYNATWSRAWNGDGSVHSTNGELVQGTYGGDNHRSWIGFDYSQIQSDLSGATVEKVELYLYYDHWYSFDGGTAVIGYHFSTATSAPAYDGNLDDVDELRVPGWGRNVGKWVNITSAGNFTADGWRTGAHTGIVLGPGPSSSTVYYGKARGNTESKEPRLRITYTK